jgi:hypothetical protein
MNRQRELPLGFGEYLADIPARLIEFQHASGGHHIQALVVVFHAIEIMGIDTVIPGAEKKQG